MGEKALIFDIKRDCSEDGPGIRSTVFFKGCPLSCIWCQNPEGQNRRPELSFSEGFCKPGPSAVGYWMSLEECLYRLTIDAPHYKSSGGGVTLSGGEATQQMPFAQALLQTLKAKGIHTAIETCGYFSARDFRKSLLPYLDFIYFDLKLIDDEESRRYTGKSNQLILDNFTWLIKETDVPVIPRIPLIPSITTSKKNLSGISSLLQSLKVNQAVLIPYNPLWHDKRIRLNFPEKYTRRTFMTKEEQNTCIKYFSAAG